MMSRMTVQRRSLCTWAGMAAGFRAFYAVVIDGGQLFGSAWISVLAGLFLFLPVGGALIALRRMNPSEPPERTLERAVGRWGAKLIGLIFFAVLLYDAGAVVNLMSGTAKYVAMPEANRILVCAVTAAAAAIALLMGAAASANAAVLWKRLLAALLALLIFTQAKDFRIAWLTPILGPGSAEIGRNALPAAGMFVFSAAGWLMLEPEHDQKGGAILKSIAQSGLIAAVIALLFCMLIPGMMDEPPTRSFRIGRLLTNDRAGLTLEMPYVVLLYSGMLTMLVFEMAAALKSLELMFPQINHGIGAALTGIAAFLLSISPWSQREMLRTLSMWYYPLIAAPVCLIGLAAWGKMKKAGKQGSAA